MSQIVRIRSFEQSYYRPALQQGGLVGMRRKTA
jgi:hypothetical protein